MRSTLLVRSNSGYISGYILRNRQAAWADGKQIARGVVNLLADSDGDISGLRDRPQTSGYDACSSHHRSLFSIIYIMRLVPVSAI
jgi:hypothetical protein